MRNHKVPSLVSPKTRITVAKPGDVQKNRLKRPPREEIGLRYDMSQFYSLKAVLEEVLGHPVYLKLKETGTIADWRKATTRLLDAILLSITSTVLVADQNWREEIASLVLHGKETIRSCERAGDLFAALSAILTRLVFLLIGSVPSRHRCRKTVPLTADFWTLNQYRSVQYVQTAEQKQALEKSVARRREAPIRVQSELDGDPV